MAAGLLALLALPTRAQPDAGSAACDVPAAKPPAFEWHGIASYLAKAAVKDGRVVHVEVRALTAGVDLQAQRALSMAVQQALLAAPCQPGEHTFDYVFVFDIRAAPASTVPAASASSAD